MPSLQPSARNTGDAVPLASSCDVLLKQGETISEIPPAPSADWSCIGARTTAPTKTQIIESSMPTLKDTLHTELFDLGQNLRAQLHRLVLEECSRIERDMIVTLCAATGRQVESVVNAQFQGCAEMDRAPIAQARDDLETRLSSLEERFAMWVKNNDCSSLRAARGNEETSNGANYITSVAYRKEETLHSPRYIARPAFGNEGTWHSPSYGTGAAYRNEETLHSPRYIARAACRNEGTMHSPSYGTSAAYRSEETLHSDKYVSRAAYGNEAALRYPSYSTRHTAPDDWYLQITGRRGTFVNFQHRAYDALRDVETNGQKGIANVLRYVYFTLVIILILGICCFMCWGFYKVSQTSKYAEIHQETRGWVGDAVPLPTMGFELLNAGWITKISWCSIPNGNRSAKRCVPQSTHPCSKAGMSLLSCLPSNLSVKGTYGDPTYNYVVLRVNRNSTAQVGIGDMGSLSLAWQQHLTLFSDVVMKQLYSFNGQRPVAHEIFFGKVLSIVGEPLGFAGRHGNDESEEWLDSKVSLAKVTEYDRALAQDASNSQAINLYLRADVTQREDFYEPYSVLRLMESCGGLWTSAASIVSISVWMVACTYANAIKYYRLKLY